MKKVLFRIMMLAVCTSMMAGVMTGCKDKNAPSDPQDGNDSTKVVPASVVMRFSFHVTDSMRMVADYTISYYDREGNIKTTPLDSSEWYTVMSAYLPCKLGVRVDGAVKEGFDPANFETLTILRYYSIDYWVGDEYGDRIADGASWSHISESSVSIPGDKVQEFFNNGPFCQWLYSFDAEGNVTRLDKWE